MNRIKSPDNFFVTELHVLKMLPPLSWWCLTHSCHTPKKNLPIMLFENHFNSFVWISNCNLQNCKFINNINSKIKIKMRYQEKIHFANIKMHNKASLSSTFSFGPPDLGKCSVFHLFGISHLKNYFLGEPTLK